MNETKPEASPARASRLMARISRRKGYCCSSGCSRSNCAVIGAKYTWKG